MCEVFAGQDPARYRAVNRSVRIAGHSTSIQIEAAFWVLIDEIAASQSISRPSYGNVAGVIVFSYLWLPYMILPIYAELVKTPKGLELAKQAFEKAKPGYHPITTASVQDLLAKAEAK